MEAALSRALSGNPQLKTIEKMAEALDCLIQRHIIIVLAEVEYYFGNCRKSLPDQKISLPLQCHWIDF